MVKPTLQDVLSGTITSNISDAQKSMAVGPLVLDSRKIKAPDTFVAMPGAQVDGREFIKAAFEQGAELVFAEAGGKAKYAELIQQCDEKRIIWVEKLQLHLSLIASNYFNHPSELLKNIGVTGTNGKTSCTYLIAKTLQKMNFECYLLGTLGVGEVSNLQTSENTTVDAITMQMILSQAVEAGAQFAAMEVSSHGLVQSRVNFIRFDTAVLTNLTRDHLDYHGSMENYAEAKRKLFIMPKLKNVVLNMDDRFGRKLAKDMEIKATKWLVTTKLPTSGSNLNRWIWAEEVVYSSGGLQAKLYTPWGSGTLNSPLIGRFNLSNLLIVVAALGAILKDVSPILGALKSVHAAPGRMQKFGESTTPLAVVDYAHTPDALEQSLLALREHCVGVIWCIFGCGGDRDSGKRPLMARIAEKLANKVIVTSDNPRTESSDKIKEDIFSGFKRPERVLYVENREQAIISTLKEAKPGEAILIAGKGHEDYQIIGHQKTHLSDLEIAKQAIERYNA